MMTIENEATLQWLEGAREFASNESLWELLRLLNTLREEDLFEMRLADQWAQKHEKRPVSADTNHEDVQI